MGENHRVSSELFALTGGVQPYAWGTVDGISRMLGGEGSGQPEAEFWLGAHPVLPSRLDGAAWDDLAVWEAETGGHVPYLLKLLSVAGPLSLQAHPTNAQAAAGFAREDADGIPRDAAHRNYRDPYAKPELVVALHDGFEALCGFRLAPESVRAVQEWATIGTARVFEPWLRHLTAEDPVRAAFGWLLAGGDDVDAVVAELTALAASNPARGELVHRLATAYPGDAGVAVAVMMNHVTLSAGESLWLPAGNIHAYLRGDAVELMGPSDNVLRGGLTPKHVDPAELLRVVDAVGRPASFLPAEHVSASAVAYRPGSLPSGADVGIELIAVTADTELELDGPVIGVTVDGEFTAQTPRDSIDLPCGRAFFLSSADRLCLRGSGRLFLAAPHSDN